MANYNNITLVGRLGKDPELSITPNGTPVCKFVIAVDDFISKEKKATYWFNIVTFGNLAEVCEKYLNKGSLVLIAGKATMRTYEDKNKQQRTWHEIVASSMQMLDKKPSVSPVKTDDDYDPFLDDEEIHHV